MLPIAFLSTLSLFALKGEARPLLGRRDVSSDLLQTFVLYEQWAAASYCPWNNNSTGSKIVCTGDECPLVQEDNTISVLEFKNTPNTDTTGFVATDSTDNLIVISFRGTEGDKNSEVDLNFALTDADICSGCQVDTGFWESWLDIRDPLVSAVTSAAAANPGYKIAATGHSLGAAVATLAAVALRNNGLNVDLINFGSPRVGDPAFAQYATNQNKGGNYRITHNKDLVPQLPPQSFGFKHISPEYWITSGNNVPVTTKDITVCTGIGNSNCNAKTAGNANDHSWYFAAISACYGDAVED